MTDALDPAGIHPDGGKHRLVVRAERAGAKGFGSVHGRR